MPRRFFRKFKIKRQSIEQSWWLAPFRNFVHEPRYWGIRRRTVVPAFAIGLFVAWMPFPGHPLWAAFIALGMRVNIVVAALTTFISNPLTMTVMYYGGYRLGRYLLDTEPRQFSIEMSWDWVTHQFVAIWQPLMLGTFILGAISALVAYIVIDVLWRLSLHEYKSKKRRERENNGSA